VIADRNQYKTTTADQHPGCGRAFAEI